MDSYIEKVTSDDVVRIRIEPKPDGHHCIFIEHKDWAESISEADFTLEYKVYED